MKKEKQQSPAKVARKAIQERLIKELKSIAAQLQKQGIHSDIDVEKESKKLAKKITKGAKVDQPAAPKETAPVEAKTPAKAAEPVKPKAVAKPAAPKAEKVVVPATAPKPAAAAPVSKTVKPAAKKNAVKK